MMRALALVLLTGCIVVPKTVTTERQLRAYETPAVATPRGVWVESATVSYGTIHVEATLARVCSHDVRAVMEKRTATSLGIAGVGDPGINDGYVLLLVGTFEMVALPASLLISGIIVAASDDDVETSDTSVRHVEMSCPVPAAGVTFELALPSGTTVQQTTDAAGALAYRIPDGEPANGVVIVRLGGREMRVAYP
ncbi:MAG: hypothetical protein JO257_13990 [Deltaproteobacteria bacterium]|nr:hypothetical protein [Deltaproteobacteria bacterium]